MNDKNAEIERLLAESEQRDELIKFVHHCLTEAHERGLYGVADEIKVFWDELMNYDKVETKKLAELVKEVANRPFKLIQFPVE